MQLVNGYIVKKTTKTQSTKTTAKTKAMCVSVLTKHGRKFTYDITVPMYMCAGKDFLLKSLIFTYD